MFSLIIEFIQDIFNTKDYIPLHEPRFIGNEKKYVNDCIDSTFVSSVGEYVNKFEEMICDYTDTKYAIATVNGTAALHVALILSDVVFGDEVIAQPLSFVATCNAIRYLNANPVFIDVDKETLGLSPNSLEEFLSENAFLKDDGFCYNKITGNRIKACVPMHTFGHPVSIDGIKNICDKYNIALVEDAAESIGSRYKGRHTGTFGDIGILSFNGNKTITCGGGGMIITNREVLAKKAKHITTTAKVPHKWEFIHDMVGYNYRLPNLNAAFACAQMENLDTFIDNKRKLAVLYSDFFKSIGVEFINEPKDCLSNYWLNGIILENKEERDSFLKFSNANNVMTRPIWRLSNKLEMYKENICGDLSNAEWLEDRVVNIPSSVRL